MISSINLNTQKSDFAYPPESFLPEYNSVDSHHPVLGHLPKACVCDGGEAGLEVATARILNPKALA
jgi:hypothetical protein